ncbi:rho GTPase-activating protein 190-like [Tubulanus polymorphus]|uniref:rho GTPase-activating protein 190-like n=1 Tax=Tubulanus polymorphus TaxID=672921 RepID=UPI003DA4DF71
MAKRAEKQIYNISIVGLSGTEKEKGTAGVGKSCLCNRFVRPLADDYYTDHISVLSQSDFSGRVVNNAHFLYWGEVTKTDDGVDYTFNVIEQTEFVDDTSFLPFKSGKIEPYNKRCCQTRIQSAEKLMYICKDQLVLEQDYPQKFLPDSRLVVDGFLCVFDVSEVAHRPVERQVEMLTHILNNIMRTKKPVVLVTTKMDESVDAYVREAEKLICRKEYRNSIQIVETSAHDNVNVEYAFINLAHLIDKNKNRVRVAPFVEASRARKEVLEVAHQAYAHLIKTHVTDYHAVWTTWRQKYADNSDFNHYVELYGSRKAKELFERHVSTLRDQHIVHRKQQFMDRLPGVLSTLLPDLETIDNRSWEEIQQMILNQPEFSEAFILLDNTMAWYDYPDVRIPFDLLLCEEAEMIFKNHLNSLQAELRRQDLCRKFRKLLSEHQAVKPGKLLPEVSIHLIGRESYDHLSEMDRFRVYEDYQRTLKERARHDFLEMLFEKYDMFSRYETIPKLTTEDLHVITRAIQDEPRYQAMNRLEDDRRNMLQNHLAFLQMPMAETCPFKENCADRRAERILQSKAHRPQSWHRGCQWILDQDESHINLVLLGSNGLSDELSTEIRNQCIDDEYAHGETIHSLDYRPIDGDVTLPHNSLKTDSFSPHGCICIYSSPASLLYLKDSLDKTLFTTEAERGGGGFQGLPTVVVFAYDPSVSEKVLNNLREEGQNLADRLQCPFIDFHSALVLENHKRFHESQVKRCVNLLLDSIKHRSSFVELMRCGHWDPDMRVVMCLMCGDGYNMEVPLGPLLAHQCCSVTIGNNGRNTVHVEAYLGDGKRKIDVNVTSYHGASSLVNMELFHGYILVYSAKRKASLAALKVFLAANPQAPILILAVTESGGANAFFANEFTQSLITEGNAIADELNAKFMTTSANFAQQVAVYTPFMKECWESKDTTEAASYAIYDPDSPWHDHLYGPPRHLSLSTRVPVPKGIYFTAPDNNRDSDSEPLYDQPSGFDRCGSDSEPERASSSSPPYYDSTTQCNNNGIYCEIPADHNPDSSHLRRTGWVDSNIYESTGGGPHDDWVDSSIYESMESMRRPPSKPKLPPGKPSKGKMAMGMAMLKTLGNARKGSQPTLQAPLATMDPIEIGDYATVKDALLPEENDYALVQDALPAGTLHRIWSTFRKPSQPEPKGGTDSDSEFSSLERSSRDTIYSRVNRKPTPHKKKHHRQRPPVIHQQIDEPAPIPLIGDDRCPLITHKGQENTRCVDVYTNPSCAHSNSPSEGSEGTEGDEQQHHHRKPVLRRRSLKKKKTSIDTTSSTISPPLSDSDQLMFGVGRMRVESVPPMYPIDPDDDSAIYEPVGIIPRYFMAVPVIEDQDPVEDGGVRRRRWFRSDKDSVDKSKKKNEEKRKSKEVMMNSNLQVLGCLCSGSLFRGQKPQKFQEKIHRKMMRKKDSKVGPVVPPGFLLEDYIQAEDNNIPLFVEKCIRYIEDNRGLETEGIYRVPGNRAHVDLLLEKFKEDTNIPIGVLDIPVNAVATALKTFFSELAEPLVPSHLYDELIEAAVVSDKSTRLLLLRGVVKKLPPVNHEVLKYLITHIHVVTEHQLENNMDSRNLAIVWWPTILRPDFTSFEKMAESSKFLEEIVFLFIEQYGFFFYDKDEV